MAIFALRVMIRSKATTCICTVVQVLMKPFDAEGLCKIVCALAPLMR